MLAGALLFSVGAVGTVAALVWSGQRSVTRVPVEGRAAPGDFDADGVVDMEGLDHVLNILVVGSDSRKGLSERERRELKTGDLEGLRNTDTIMLWRLDPKQELAALLSFPRDLRVTRCDDTVGKINSAYTVGEAGQMGGPSCLVQTVNKLTGVAIQHYVEVDFAGFLQVVDILDGVSLYLDKPMRDRKAGIALPAGCVTLTGGDALGFVRTRKYDSDYGRIARQQRFIRELVAEATSTGMLMNVPRMFSLVDAAAGAVDTDEDLSLDVMRRIVISMRGLSNDQLITRTVPATTERIDGLLYEVLRADRAEQLFKAFRQGELLPPEPGDPTKPDPLRPEDVPPITVLNGAGEEGLAVDARQALEADGFTVAVVDNAERFDFTRTVVRYPSGQQAEARLVAKRIGEAALRKAKQAENLVVVLGADFDPATMTGAAPSEAASEGAEGASEIGVTDERFRGAGSSDVDC